ITASTNKNALNLPLYQYRSFMAIQRFSGESILVIESFLLFSYIPSGQCRKTTGEFPRKWMRISRSP
ncbi:MAG: hypothetical protein D6681_20095, partial [Calditrichaeota bacterium]